MEHLERLLWLLKPEGIQWLIQAGGLPAICLIVFAETGFFALLPGDSMLVLCGIFAGTIGDDGRPLLSLPLLLGVVPVCGVLGDQVGYWIGTWFGRAMYGWRDRSLLGIPIFKRAYLTRTEEFYGRWGTFFIVAGIIKMRFRTFISFNCLGAFTWVWSMVLAGYFLPPLLKKVAPGFDLARNIDKIALVVVLLSLLPILWTVYKERRVGGSAASA